MGAAMWGRFTFIFSVFLLITVPALGAERVALVVGNGAYLRVPILPNPTRDAADDARALERLDFKVTQLSNGTAADMRQAQTKQLGGDSRCDRMHDRLGCLCAVQNGGGISPDGKRWWSKRRTSDPPNEAFVQCQLRAGRT